MRLPTPVLVTATLLASAPLHAQDAQPVLVRAARLIDGLGNVVSPGTVTPLLG